MSSDMNIRPRSLPDRQTERAETSAGLYRQDDHPKKSRFGKRRDENFRGSQQDIVVVSIPSLLAFLKEQNKNAAAEEQRLRQELREDLERLAREGVETLALLSEATNFLESLK